MSSTAITSNNTEHNPTKKVVFSGALTISGHAIDMTAGICLTSETCCAALNRSMIMSTANTVNNEKACRIEEAESHYYFKFLLPRGATMNKISCIDYEAISKEQLSHIEIINKNMNIGDYYQMTRDGDYVYLPKKLSNYEKFSHEYKRSNNDLLIEQGTKIFSRYWDVYYFRIPFDLENGSGFQNARSRTYFPFFVNWKMADSKTYLSFISYFADNQKEDHAPNDHELKVRDYVSHMLAGNIMGYHEVPQYDIEENISNIMIDNNVDISKLFKKKSPIIPKSIEKSPYNILDPLPQYYFNPEHTDSIDLMNSDENYKVVENLITSKNEKLENRISSLIQEIIEWEKKGGDHPSYFIPFSEEKKMRIVENEKDDDDYEYDENDFSYANVKEEDIMENIIQGSNFYEEKPISRKDYPIYLPIVATEIDDADNVRLMSFYPEQTYFTKTMVEHLHAISSNLIEDTNTGKLKLTNENEDIYFTYKEKDYGFIKLYNGHRKVNVDIYFNNRTISKLFAGSNPVVVNNPALIPYATASGSSHFASFGFGCLNTVSIKFACDKIEKAMGDVWSLDHRNGVFNELIGFTSQNLDEVIFANAHQFYSNSASNQNLPTCIFNWFKTLYNNKFKQLSSGANLLTDINDKYIKIMNEAFLKYIKDLKNNFSTNTSNSFVNCELKIRTQEIGIDLKNIVKEKTSFTKILQNGPSFYGRNSNKTDEWQTTKIISMMDQVTRTMTVNTPQGVILDPEFIPKKYPEGGNVLIYMNKKEPENTKYNIGTSGFNIYENKDHHSPYGYLAKNLTRMSSIVGNHLDYFIPSRYEAVEPKRVKFGDKSRTSDLIKIDTPSYITFSSIMMGVGSTEQEKEISFGRKGPLASPVIYYKHDSTDDYDVQELDSRRRQAALKLPDLKNIWINYMKTPMFFRECADIDRLKINEDRLERKFALKLAEHLAEKYGDYNSSIYNIIPSRENTLEDTKKIVKIISSDKVSFVSEKSISNPNVTHNYYKIGNVKYAIYSEYSDDKIEIKPDLAKIIASKQNQVNKLFPHTYKNFITNSDNRDFTLRVYDFLECYEKFKKNQDIKNYYPNVLINGYLLSNNFESKQLLEARSLLTRFDYLALSASVYYEKNPVHNQGNKIFKVGLIGDVKTSNGENLFSVYEKEFNGNHIKDTVLESVYANVSDVPLYSFCRKNNQVVFKTLNSAFSPSTSCMYYFARSIASSNNKYTHTFKPLEGVPYSIEKTNIGKIDTTNLSQYTTKERQTTYDLGSNILNKMGDVKGKVKGRVETITNNDLSKNSLNPDDLVKGVSTATENIWSNGNIIKQLNLNHGTNFSQGPKQHSLAHKEDAHYNLINILALYYDAKIKKDREEHNAKKDKIKEEIIELEKSDGDKNKLRELKNEYARLGDIKPNIRLIDKSNIIEDISILDRTSLEELDPSNERRIEGNSLGSLIAFTYSHESKTFRTDGVEVSADKLARDRLNNFIRNN